jgi:hypothetical protein
VTNTNGQQFFVSVTHGTIQGTPASGGRVNLILSGSTVTTYLEINQIVPAHRQAKGAHNFNSTLANSTGILNIASITVKSGAIFAIEGYHTAVLSGPLTVSSNNAVNRIAFQAIRPGGSINVGGDLDTLDIFNDANFSQSIGLKVGQDLNWAEIGGSLTVNDGANVTIGRDLGLLAQAAKGSGNAGQGLFVNGNLTVSAPSRFSIGRNLGSPPTVSAPIPFSGILVNGNLSGASRFSIGGSVFGQVTVVGTTTS